MLLSKILYNLRGRWLAVLIRRAGGKCGPNLKVEGGFRLGFQLHSGVELGRNVYFGPNCLVDCPPGATLKIHDDVTFTAGVVIGCHSHVRVSNDVIVGEYTSIRDSEHGFDVQQRDTASPASGWTSDPVISHARPRTALPIRKQPMVLKAVDIQSDVWIGRGCAILGGTVLGSGCVVGANSVTKTAYAPYKVIVGAPGRVVASRLDPSLE